MAQPQTSPFDERRIQDRFRQLEQRLRRIEAHLGLEEAGDAADSISSGLSDDLLTASEYSPGRSIELGIGEFGLGWIGSVILFLGIVFLMTYAFAGGHKMVACLLGYGAAAGLYLAARYWEASVPHLSHTTLASSLLLLYYATARLHFFSDSPVIENDHASLALVLAAVAFIFAYALRRGSQALAGLALLLGLLTALLSDRTAVIFALAIVHSALAAFLALRRGWRSVLNLTIPLVYLTHLLWLVGNPVAGHDLSAVPQHEYNLVYLFLYAAIFSLPTLFLKRESLLDAPWIGTILVNALSFSLVVSVVSFVHFRVGFPAIYFGAATGCLVLSIAHWVRRHEELVPAIYACFGYLALSIAICGAAGIPAAFLWLSLQSLLVVSMALWFRSRVLVVSNSLIYVGMLVVYLIVSASSNWVNFSFALVALASARVMNWKKQRLTLRTDKLRNVYLAMAFFLVLYSLYRAVPGQYLALTWTAAACGYFILSLLLHNIKYRWMAMFTMIIAIVYLLVVDLARLSSISRVAAFLFLGLIALLISVFYTKYKHLLGKPVPKADTKA